jgi:hypothetical protein
MTIALRNFDERVRSTVADERVRKASMGLGYWGAMDYFKKKKEKK